MQEEADDLGGIVLHRGPHVWLVPHLHPSHLEHLLLHVKAHASLGGDPGAGRPWLVFDEDALPEAPPVNAPMHHGPVHLHPLSAVNHEELAPLLVLP